MRFSLHIVDSMAMISALLLVGCNKMVEIPANEVMGVKAFKIDPYEASFHQNQEKFGKGAVSKRGVAPAVRVNFFQAKQACEEAGKRLCTKNEWIAACKGPNNRLFGMQDTHNNPRNIKEICDVARTENNTPGSLPSETGSRRDCKTDGLPVWDMIGNLAEWTVDDAGNPFVSGVAFYQNAEHSNCDGALVELDLSSIPPTEQDTDIGFRCCK